uniref:glutathione hydrolase 1 proenzyme-like n=1 Tax=Styela clava TaxID=7725 RepID=UPI0019393D8B|nr:glutathione hydrolase 1 proenzyme-like [Styela clava]
MGNRRMSVGFMLIAACILAIFGNRSASEDIRAYLINQPDETQESRDYVFEHAAVAASQLECSVVGTDIMQAGGNAVDAAIATTMCEGVVEPYHTSIGGGATMLIYNSTTKSVTSILSKEKAPADATPNMYIGDANPSRGVKSIGVPGQLRGLEYAYNKYGGRVSWAALLQPSIDKARNGFKVSGQLSIALTSLYENVIVHDTNSVFCDIYCNEDRTGVKQKGDIVINLLLADTLIKIQQHGVEGFYTGDMADITINEFRAQGGIMTKKDLMDFDVIEEAAIPIQLPNAGYTMHTAPLPMGGSILGATLSIMDLFDISPQDYDNSAALQWHRTIEAFRHSFGVRYEMGDPDMYPESQDVEDQIVSGEYAKSAIEKIHDDETSPDPAYYGATYLTYPKETFTTHVSVIDQNKIGVAITSTISSLWGSYFMSPTTGIVYNNVMSVFSYPTGDPDHDSKLVPSNQIEGGKRARSTMSPAIFLDENSSPAFIVGSAGGVRIPTSIAQVMLRILYFGTDFSIESSINKRRLHDSLSSSGAFEYEDRFDPDIVEELKRIGHKSKIMTSKARVNAIQLKNSQIHAFSDMRNEGAGPSGW